MNETQLVQALNERHFDLIRNTFYGALATLYDTAADDVCVYKLRENVRGFVDFIAHCDQDQMEFETADDMFYEYKSYIIHCTKSSPLPRDVFLTALSRAISHA